MTDKSDVVVKSTLADGVVQLMINRPERRNALNGAVLNGLVTHLARVAETPDERVVVLTGAGDKAFCAGGDLSPSAGQGFLAMHEDRRGFVTLFRAMRELGKPIIARVQGHCLAGGLGLMVACDLAVAAERATFGTPEIKRGLFPMMIMALIFRNVGRKKGMELILTGERIDAHEAERIGLINRVVADDELDQAVLQLASRIASYSPAILKLGRDAFYAQDDLPLEKALDYLHTQLTLNTMTEDAAEGVMAFFQKREPQWKGR